MKLTDLQTLINRYGPEALLVDVIEAEQQREIAGCDDTAAQARILPDETKRLHTVKHGLPIGAERVPLPQGTDTITAEKPRTIPFVFFDDEYDSDCDETDE